MFTVKDAVFNEMLRGVYSDISSKISEETDLADQIINSITGPEGKKLNKVASTMEEDNAGGATEDMSDEEIVEHYLNDLNPGENPVPQESTTPEDEVAASKFIEGFMKE